jgi:CRISPR-associated protein Csh1
LTLKGRDLPELYIKIRSKLLDYEAEKSAKVRELVTEIGNLGVRLGDRIVLDEISTNYYLLLGQSVAKDVFTTKK